MDSWVGKICWRRDRLSTPIFFGFPGGSAGKESAYNVGDLGNLGPIPGLGRSSGEGNGYPLQYSGLENSMDCIVHGISKSQTQLRRGELSHSASYLSGQSLDTPSLSETGPSRYSRSIHYFLYLTDSVICEKYFQR